MSPDRWPRVEALFSELVELPAAERAARLAGADRELRAEVETLLRHDPAARGALEAAVGGAAAALPEVWADEETGVAAGLRIGSWSLVRELGSGGMGAVWLAERVEGSFRQPVAIKLIRPGRESRQLIARFEEERRILAGLVHPGIARLLDGGAIGGSNGGRPYFVMEYVEGRPLTEFAAALPIARRLELFVAVAAAVAFAHRNLVVHRDIKPGNVLVDAAGEPKLLDFGIAKLIDPQSDATQTVAGWLAFSPEYASPEQVTGERITTATDVYALGAVLYELLAGRKAQPIPVATPAAILRAVCETEPPRPSLAAPQLARELAGDLDAIVMKALRKAPEARYASAAELADDLRRFLAAEPVRARQGKFSYRARLFVRRNRLAVAAGLLVALSLFGGLLATAWQAGERAREARLAERRFAQVRGLATRFLFDFEKAITKLPGSTEARRMVVATAVEHLDGLAAEAGGDAGLQLELAQAYFRLGRLQGSADSSNLGQIEEGLQSFHKCRDLALLLVAQEPRAEHLEMLAMARLETAILLAGTARRAAALEEIDQGLAVSRLLVAGGGAPAHRRLQSSLLLRLSDVQREEGELVAARAALEEALTFESRDATTTLARLGLVSREAGDLEAARDYFEKALASMEGGGRGAPKSTECFLQADLARILFAADSPSLERGAEAAAVAARGIACGEVLVAADPRDVTVRFALLEPLKTAGAILAATEPGRGLAILDRAAAELAAAARLAPQAFNLPLESALIDLSRGLALARLGRHQEARRLLERTRPALAAAAGQEAADVRAAEAEWQLELRLGEVYEAEGRAMAAAGAYRRARELAGAGGGKKASKPALRFPAAEAAERLARLALRGDGAVTLGEARELAGEAAAVWRAWKNESLTTAYADAALSANAELQAALAASAGGRA